MAQTVPEDQQTSADPEFTQHAGFLLAQLGRAVTRQYRTAFSPIGLKPRATAALLRLRSGGPLSQQTLGATLDIEASNLVVLLNELEAEGLISRRRDPQDRRRHVVEISEHGAKAVCEVERAAGQVEDEFFAALTGDERCDLRELLARLADSADVVSAADVTGEDC
jgi:MarR family transcriptional regulator, lower aerobic nicotinate degradation pathway regulator